MKLLTESNQKIRKGEKLGFFTVGLHLAPAKLAGLDINLCPWASKGCEAACLNTSGHDLTEDEEETALERMREIGQVIEFDGGVIISN